MGEGPALSPSPPSNPNTRIKKSKELLLQYPYIQIKEIALLAGFEDANYFCSVFKKLEQISPNQFRKIHHN
ncbi:helix-turn-helix domain-containing protein [Paenibacillus sp. NPDC056579]|uniref:helix-turn-helix domain-containing protein n=1 Tax=Paenibacillus sp. NPDC056579 TaxID=3345871 RepID=UPI00368048B7